MQHQRLRWQARKMSDSKRRVRCLTALSDEEVAKMEALGVVWDLHAGQWDRYCTLLRTFRDREGHSDVPGVHVEGGCKLGYWLERQRERWQARGMSEVDRVAKNRRAVIPLSDEAVAQLTALGVAPSHRHHTEAAAAVAMWSLHRMGNAPPTGIRGGARQCMDVATQIAIAETLADALGLE